MNKSDDERLTYDLWPEFGKLLGLGRTSTYKAAQRGEIPTINVGGSKKVPKKKAHEKFGI
jgi:hypothetical protein